MVARADQTKFQSEVTSALEQLRTEPARKGDLREGGGHDIQTGGELGLGNTAEELEGELNRRGENDVFDGGRIGGGRGGS